MSAHFSKYRLNTYSAVPYFLAHIPVDYPLGMVMIRSRTFHALPPRLRELARLSKIWACRNYPALHGIEGIEDWYDAEGYELDPGTGRRLTPQEIEAEWENEGFGPAFPVVDDIPIPPGGFADPVVWLQPEDEPELVDRADLTAEQVLSDIASRGREWTAGAYGMPTAWLTDVHTDRDLAATILAMDGNPWPMG